MVMMMMMMACPRLQIQQEQLCINLGPNKESRLLNCTKLFFKLERKF